MHNLGHQTLRAWHIAMIAQSLSERTISERIRLVQKLEKDTNIDPVHIDPNTLIIWLSKTPSAATRHSYYVSLRAWFRWLVLHDHRADDPMIKVPVPKRPKYKPRPSAASHVTAVLQSNLSRVARTQIMYAALAGLRVSEIARLHGSTIDLVNNLIEVRGKGGRTDTLPLHPLLIEDAKTYPRRDYWFPTRAPSRRPHTHEHTVRRNITGAFENVGIVMKPHQLRHFFATSLLASGVDSRVVQTLMRHENLATTALYMEVTVEQQQTALAQLKLATAFSPVAA